MTRIQMRAFSVGVMLMLGAMSNASAQRDIKIGFVNVPFLVQNAPQTMALSQRLQSEFAPREAELQANVNKLTEKVEKYERDSSVMGEAERTTLQREIEQGRRDLERQQNLLQEDFQIRQNEMLGELQNLIGQEVQAYVDAEGYDLILADVVYVSDNVDITEEVLQAITASYSAASGQ